MSLVTTRTGECVGATFVGRDGALQQINAPRTLMATGGAGQVFRETTNPAIATGDGIAMAFDAGARVADLEFVQFHPTALSAEGAPRFLLSEALRGEGARLINGAGEPFMTRYEPAGDLASRDLVARAIVKEVARTGAPVYLTMAHLAPDYVSHRFPTIARACREAGFDLATDRVPVSPAAHYVMGGVETDLHGRTSVSGLFAAGEVACTGVHGANRLASNSLLEGLVFGARAADAMRGSGSAAAALAATLVTPIDDEAASTPSLPEPLTMRDLMWQQVGLVRTADGLRAAVPQLAAWRAGCRVTSRSRARRPRLPPPGKPGDGRFSDRASRPAPRRNTWRPLPIRFPESRRYTLQEALCRRASHVITPDSRLSWLTNKTFRTIRNPSLLNPRTSAAGTSMSSAAPSWPTIHRSKGAWSSVRTVMRSGS
jgi:aspartate oxidase